MCNLTEQMENQSHEDIIKNIIEYNNALELSFQLYTEYEDIDGLLMEEYILQEQDIYFTILGTTSAVLFLYNELEQYEKSAELYKEMKRGFLLIYDKIFPATNNEEKFCDLINKMFDTYKTIFKND